jgi:molecular chaperone GrpE
LTPDDVAAVLADFRAWLAAGAPPTHDAESPAPSPAIDLYTLLSQFVALRHEVNLQTRAARAQQEHNAAALRHLEQALEALQEVQAGAQEAQQQAADESLRPLLKTLVDLYDSLALAGREMQRAQDVLLPLLDQLAVVEPPAGEPAPQPSPPAAPLPAGFWRRLLGRSSPEVAPAPAPNAQARAEQQRRQREARQERERQGREALERVRQMLGALVTGYTMSLQRVERALHQHGLEPMPAVGEPFDPELMEVVEAAEGTGRPAGEVLQEVRRGYLWNGRIFRYAQVRVARS